MFRALLYVALRRLLRLVTPRDRLDEATDAENLVLRHQLGILRRQVKRPVYRMRDRALLAAASRLLPRERWSAFLVQPETIMRWHKGLVARKWTSGVNQTWGRPVGDGRYVRVLRPGR